MSSPWDAIPPEASALAHVRRRSGGRLELADRVRELASLESTARTLVVANNHFQGKAVKLALELRAAHEGGKVAVPEPLLGAYPELRGIARGVLF